MKFETQSFDIETKVRQDCYNRGYEQGRKNPDEEIVKYIEKLQNQVKEYQDKIEQGTIIELPCKVSDTVYWLIANKYIIECVVSLINISVGKKTHFTVWAKQKCEGVENDFSSDDLGEEWFVTREEAEKRLKELQNG